MFHKLQTQTIVSIFFFYPELELEENKDKRKPRDCDHLLVCFRKHPDLGDVFNFHKLVFKIVSHFNR